MKNLFVAALLILSYNMVAQSIQCPADQTVHLFDLDQDYNTYGIPDFSGPSSYDITQSITIIDNSCQGNFGIVTTLNYELVDITTNTVVAECDQVISVQRPDISEFTFPQEYMIAEATLDELTPDITGHVEPKQFLNGASTFISAYADQVINSGNGIRILRTWTILDWCTGNTIDEIQIIRVTTLAFTGSGPMSVSKCDNSPLEVDNVIVTTDAPGFTIEYGSCPNTSDDITDFLNCVAANNDIPTSNKFIVEVVKDGDDLNGVSTLDLVLTQRHILGQQRFDEECEIKAADVNNDNVITAIDLLTSRKLILGIYGSLPESSSWRFFNEGYTAQPLTSAGFDFIFGKSEFPISDLQIVGIKVGDVNNSASGN